MRTPALFISTLLAATLLSACYHKPDMLSSSKVRMDLYPNSNVSGANHRARNAAENFIGHINYARIALAHNHGDRAEKHIAEARTDMDRMKLLTNAQPKIADIESGRFVYSYDPDYKYHYFPIETDSIEVKKMGHGPMWAKNDLAVTDAEVVTLTVDLSRHKVDTRLDNAEADIKSARLKAADAELAQLTDEVVVVDSTIPMPIDMARDNIILAKAFIVSGNYTGACYALRHADIALGDMQRPSIYSQHQVDIAAMRRDIKYLQNELTRKNPAMMQKTDAKLGQWWSQLEDWSAKES